MKVVLIGQHEIAYYPMLCVLLVLLTHWLPPYNCRNSANLWKSDKPRPLKTFIWDKTLPAHHIDQAASHNSLPLRNQFFSKSWSSSGQDESTSVNPHVSLALSMSDFRNLHRPATDWFWFGWLSVCPPPPNLTTISSYSVT